MYQAKAAGKARYQVFDKDGRSASLHHMQKDLAQAVDRRQLLLFYQPIVTLKTGRLLGFEALVRWKHPERGIISPVDFISIAEGTGAINPIARWVVREACHQLRQWHDQYPFHRYVTMSVNLSGKQFTQPDLIDQIVGALQETSLDPLMLKLEITESVLMDNSETSAAMLQQLRALGVELSIDDFGTGYSSLSYLHRLPINNLKIDRSFVSRLKKNDENTEIIGSIVTLARRLGMSVVAEGVETLQQLAELRRLDCDAGQGYLFSKPVGAKAAGNLMGSKTKWQAALASLTKQSRHEPGPKHSITHGSPRPDLLQAV
jgi:EAL domain-containing protein (putative c-di-GMP-specific phosphodiesterase class I)